MAKRRVAILGGGMGAMAAAWALTSLPDARDRFDVHVYQMGWRLGGKGASGRNAAQGQRIEEHGLHVWAGFYDNAFRLMRECFAELEGEEGTYRSLEEAFRPDDNIVLGDLSPRGWEPWIVKPPRRDGEPGRGETDLSPLGYLQRLADFVRDSLASLDDELGPLAVEPAAPDSIDRLRARAASPALRGGPARDSELADLARVVQAGVRVRLSAVEALGDPLGGLRRAALLLDLSAAALRGMVADRVFERGFDDLDGEEISDWLERHGASEASLDSGLVLWIYAYVFGYRGGVTSRLERAVAAGTCLRGLLRLLLTYKGAVFYRMRAGMGDTIFTPLCKALCKRGVRFHFFHRVTGLHLDAAGQRIERIAMDRQVTVRGGEYRPFVRVKDLDCWPSEPLWDQIEEGPLPVDLESAASAHVVAERLELRRGAEFDEVVLGIPVGALRPIAGELIAASPAWKRMVERVRTTATQAVQLWLDAPSPDLGWPHGPSILTAYADELNTWADMSELLPSEDWPEGARPRSISYFCGQISDPAGVGADPAAARARVMAEARDWMGIHLPFVYPHLPATPEGLARRLVHVGGESPDARWAGQFFRANVEGTDRYVQSVPGATRARLPADRSGFENLWLAGDWTYTGLNAGCVEAAAMSGLRAAAGLAGLRPEIVGEEEAPDAPPLPPVAAVPPILRTYRPQSSGWPWSAVYGMAETRGASLMLPVPRAAAQAMLPPSLGLAPQGLTGPESHPVLLLFARQDDVRPNALPALLRPYHEFICVVPWVVHRDPARSGLPPMIWPQKLLLDSVLAIGLGVHGYGYPKERARIDFRQDGYAVTHPGTGNRIISATWSRTGARGPARDFPCFAEARPAWEMAMVTQRGWAGWQYSVYDFSLETALLEPLEMEVQVGPNSFGLPPGTYHAPSLSDSPLGGFFLTADGAISNPLQSFDIQRRLRGAGR